MKRFPGKKKKSLATSPSQPQVTGRFSANSRPGPRTPNLVLEAEVNGIKDNNSHLELEVRFNKYRGSFTSYLWSFV